MQIRITEKKILNQYNTICNHGFILLTPGLVLPITRRKFIEQQPSTKYTQTHTDYVFFDTFASTHKLRYGHYSADAPGYLELPTAATRVNFADIVADLNDQELYTLRQFLRTLLKEYDAGHRAMADLIAATV